MKLIVASCRAIAGNSNVHLSTLRHKKLSLSRQLILCSKYHTRQWLRFPRPPARSFGTSQRDGNSSQEGSSKGLDVQFQTEDGKLVSVIHNGMEYKVVQHDEHQKLGHRKQNGSSKKPGYAFRGSRLVPVTEDSSASFEKRGRIKRRAKQQQTGMPKISKIPSDPALRITKHTTMDTSEDVTSITEDESHQSTNKSPGNAWALRIAPHLDQTSTERLYRTPIRRLLGRIERSTMLESASNLREVLSFASTIQADPWTDEELVRSSFVMEREEDQAEQLDQSTSETFFETTTKGRLSNLSILAGYIDLKVREPVLSSEEHDILLLELFDDAAIWYLERNGYSIEEVVTWAWILRTESNYDAIVRFLVCTNRPMPHKRIPRSVFHMLLDRNLQQPSAVQLMMIHLDHRISNTIDRNWESIYNDFVQKTSESIASETQYVDELEQKLESNLEAESKSEPEESQRQEPAEEQEMISKSKSEAELEMISYPESKAELEAQTEPESNLEPEQEQANYVKIQSKAIAQYLLRLIKFSMYSIPAILPKLATMLCEHIAAPKSQSNAREDGLSFLTSTNLTVLYNSTLAMLGGKLASPYVNVPYQERAQFIIIRHMNEFQPPLTIGLQSYRAVAEVQLKHRKTIKERLWTELKSRGWPPYREDKLGIDALKKDEVYGISRAQRAIINLKEAGYGSTEWEDSASILSGWDVHRSPTIQSRRAFTPIKHKHQDFTGEIHHLSLWESRILATRTIEEAWAVFLNYMEEDVPKTSSVFLAIFEKIVSERKRNQRDEVRVVNQSFRSLAGDGTETLPSSPNPRDQVYIPSPPPSFEEFYQRYLTYFPVLDTSALCFLLSNAENVAQGFEFVEKSDLPKPTKDVLLRGTTIQKGAKLPIRSRIFTAYIRFLSHFPSTPLPNHRHVSALSHAIHLVYTLNISRRSPWLYLLEAVDREIMNPVTDYLWLEHWTIATSIIQKMDRLFITHDEQSFHTVCSLFTSLSRKAAQSLERGQHEGFRSNSRRKSGWYRVEANNLIKRIFKQMVTINLRTSFTHRSISSPKYNFDDNNKPTFIESLQFPASLFLPDLLHIPNPALLHSFIRLLGILEDKLAVVDLLRWMSIYYRELNAKATEMANGQQQFRKTLIAVRIILQSDGSPFTPSMKLRAQDETEQEATARAIIESIPSWYGWPSDEEVREYLAYRIVDSKTEPAA